MNEGIKFYKSERNVEGYENVLYFIPFEVVPNPLDEKGEDWWKGLCISKDTRFTNGEHAMVITTDPEADWQEIPYLEYLDGVVAIINPPNPIPNEQDS